MPTQLYVIYKDYGDFPVNIQLMGRLAYDAMKNSQPEGERLYISLVQIKASLVSDLNIDIVAITEFDEMDGEQIRSIKQDVMNWLNDNGYRPKW